MTDIAERVREACAKVCDNLAENRRILINAILSQYVWTSKERILLSEYEAMQEAFEQLAAALRVLPLPPDPRDAEIAALREALRERAFIKNHWANVTTCGLCRELWHAFEPERHTPGCLAAPEAAP